MRREDVDQVRFLLRETLPAAARTWRELVGEYDWREAEVSARIHLAQSQAAFAGQIYEIDLEVRRALTLIRNGERVLVRLERELESFDVGVGRREPTLRSLIKPTRWRYGGLDIKRVEQTNSADWWLDAYGALSQVLLSDPLQLALTLQSLYGLRVRIRAVIRAAAGKEVRLAGRDDGDGREVGLRAGDIELSKLPEGTRITIEQRTPDGTETTITLEG